MKMLAFFDRLGRSRRYRRVVIDEAAFAKNGDNKVDGSMMEIWEKARKNIYRNCLLPALSCYPTVRLELLVTQKHSKEDFCSGKCCARGAKDFAKDSL